MTNKVSFHSIVWKYKGKAGWYFVTLPKQLSKKIRATQGQSEEGWGRLKTSAQVGKTIWKTAIWYDTKAQSYLLPLKAEIRKKENIVINMNLRIKLQFDSMIQTQKSKFSTPKPKMWS